MPKLLKSLKLLSVFALILLILTGCGEEAATPVPKTTSSVATTTTAANNTATAVNVGSTAANPTSAPANSAGVATAIPAATVAPTAALSQGDTANRDKILAFLKSFNSNAKNYSFKVTQNAEIKNGGATTVMDGSGTGLYAAPNFYQKLDLNVSGQGQQSIEIYLTNGAGYQKLDALGVWRKLDQKLPASATLAADLPNGATGFQVSSGGQGITQMRYTFPATLLFSQNGAGGPELLGLLSATNIYQPFVINPDRSAQVEVKLSGTEANGQMQIQHHEVSFSLNGPDGTLTYKAIYDYTTTGGTASLTPPPGLPK